MNGLHEKHHMLKTAVEVLATFPGTDRDRVARALQSLSPLKDKDFPEHMASSFYGQIRGFEKELYARKITDERLLRLKANIWALYNELCNSRDDALRSTAQ